MPLRWIRESDPGDAKQSEWLYSSGLEQNEGGPTYGALHFSAGAVELSGGRWEVTIDLLFGTLASSRWNASGCICSRWTVVAYAVQDWQWWPVCASHGRVALWTLTVSLLPALLTLTSCMSLGTFSMSVQIGHGHLSLTLSFTHTHCPSCSVPAGTKGMGVKRDQSQVRRVTDSLWNVQLILSGFYAI